MRSSLWTHSRALVEVCAQCNGDVITEGTDAKGLSPDSKDSRGKRQCQAGFPSRTQSTVQAIKWASVAGGTNFASGVMAIVIFAIGLAAGYSLRSDKSPANEEG